MRPAFSSTKSAAAFVALVVGVLSLPLVLNSELLPARERIYANSSWRMGDFPWMRRQIFEEKSDVDIAFMGSSWLFSGIDTPLVQKELAAKLGSQPVVITLGWFWSGFDATYFIAQDLLKHRRVRMMVVYDEDTRADNPHPNSPTWFRWGDNAGDLSGLPVRYQVGLYTSAVMGVPRNFLSRARQDLPLTPQAVDYWKDSYSGPSPADELGAIYSRSRFMNGSNFVDFVAQGNATPADASICSGDETGNFKFTGGPTHPYQLYFARKLAALAQANGTKLVFIHIPLMTNTVETAVPERENWPQVLSAPVTVIGIPPARFFAGLSRDEIYELYNDIHHLNQNGINYFTRLITPELLALYESTRQTH